MLLIVAFAFCFSLQCLALKFLLKNLISVLTNIYCVLYSIMQREVYNGYSTNIRIFRGLCTNSYENSVLKWVSIKAIKPYTKISELTLYPINLL